MDFPDIDTAQNPAPHHGIWRDLLLITLLFALGYGTMLGNRALWQPDEARYTEIPREMLLSGDFLTPHLDGVKYFEKPPLFYWLQAGALRWFGLSAWSARLWPVLFSLFGCLAVYAAGRTWYGRGTGLAAAGVLATSLLYFFLGRAVILDLVLTTFLSSAMLALVQGTRTPLGARRRYWFWAAYALMALATLTKGLIGFVLPGMVVAVWIVLLGEWRLLLSMYLPSGVLVFLLIAAPWHVWVSAVNPEFPYFYFVQQHFLRYLTDAEQRYQPNWFFIPILLLGFFPWTLFLTQTLRQIVPKLWARRHAHKETLFLLVWIVVVFSFFSLSHSKLVPYILPVFPPLALLLGRYLANADTASAGWRRGLLLLAFVNLSAAVSFLLMASGLWRSAAVLELQRLMGPALWIVAGAFAVGMVAALAMSRVLGRVRVLAVVMASTLLIHQCFGYAMSRMDEKYTVQRLALTLKPQLRDDDVVVSYSTYYQDLPLYLLRRITIVDWTNELTFGAAHQDTRAWMLKSPDLWALWQGPRRVFVFANTDSLTELRRQAGDRYYFLAGDKYHVLLSNEPPPP